MPRQCVLTGRQPSFGRSYTYRGIAKKKKGIGLKVTGVTNRRFNPNLQKKRIYIAEENRFITLTLSTAAMRTLDKKGLQAVLRQMRKKSGA